MNTVLYLGLGIFSLSAFFFGLSKKSKLNTAFLVSFITIISYLIMLEGSFVTQSLAGESLYWTRWIFYTFSCTLLMYSVGKSLKKDSKEITQMIYLTAIVMITGALSSIYTGAFKWAMYVISSISFIVLIYPIVSDKSEIAKKISIFIYLGWCIFPVVFLLSPEGFNMIGNTVSAGIYLLLDIFTKIIFYMVINKKQE
jgi:bacteriorhodopsin